MSLALAAVVLTPTIASANSITAFLALDQGPGQGRNQPSGEQAPKKEEAKNIDETVKDFQKIDGVFTIYRNKKGTTDQIFMEIPESKYNQTYLMQATASTGFVDLVGIFHGQPLADIPFMVKVVDDGRVLLVSPDLNQRADSDAETRRAMDRLYPDRVLYSTDIKARQDDRKSILIDLSDLLKADVADVGSNLRFGNVGYAIDRQNSYIDTIKNFPENAILRVNYRLNSMGGAASRKIPFAVSYNIMSLPKTDYMPRLGDTRVGYFTTEFRDMSDARKSDQLVNYIQRWDMRKKDPSAKLSDPVKPQVWYIDNAIPKRYRQSVRDGLLMWNEAYEKIGIKNAIIVKQMPDDADWDIADVRYNVVRWTLDMPFAIALFRANPYTGEIVNAAINFDAVFAAGGASAFDTVVGPSSMDNEFVRQMAQKYGARACTYAHEGAAQLEYGQTVMELLDTAGTAYNREDMVQQYIREVTAHEMGHCQGLRHNFTASTAFTMDQLGDPNLVAREGVTPTVMEYTPFNFSAIKRKGVDYYSRRIGRYDIWAIQYGYTPTNAKSPEGELSVLRKIASRTNEPGHAFQTDEMANSFDPYVSTFDLGKEPLDWCERRMRTSRYLLLHPEKFEPKKGQSYYELTRKFNTMVNGISGPAEYATRFIGGTRVSSNFKGDPGEKPMNVPIDGATQKRALNLLSAYVLSPNSLEFNRGIFTKLTSNPNGSGNQSFSGSRAFNMFNTFSSMQKGVLDTLFQAQRLNRLANNEFKVADPSKTLTMAGLFRTVGQNVWSELNTGQEITQLRRQLQREHLETMLRFVLDRPAGVPDDAVMLANEQLRILKDKTAAAAPRAKGAYGRAHLEECNLRIKKALSASVNEIGR